MKNYMSWGPILLLVVGCAGRRDVAATHARAESRIATRLAAGSVALPAASHSTVARARVDASLTSGGSDTRADSALIAQGKQIVGTICIACHTEQPPPKLAPPLAHISQRYRMMVGDREQALARITTWIKAPSHERSLMPPMAIQRFGLMAPLPIPEDQRRAAAAYVWSLSEGASGAAGGAGMAGMPGMRDTVAMRGMQHPPPRP